MFMRQPTQLNINCATIGATGRGLRVVLASYAWSLLTPTSLIPRLHKQLWSCMFIIPDEQEFRVILSYTVSLRLA